MNPRPIIVASIITVLFVVTVYVGGRFAFQQGRIEATSPPTVSKQSGQVDNAPSEPTTHPGDTPATNTDDGQQTGITQHPAPAVDTEVDNTPAEAETPTTAPTPITSTEQVHISPFGFGPLPEVPADFPEQDVWEEFLWFYSKYGPEIITKEHELINRVHIKLWTQGERPIGVSMEDGMVYPEYSDVIYMTRETLYADDGTIEGYKANVSAPEGVTDEQIDALTGDGITPEGYTVIPHTEAMFDPYAFLNLK